MSNCQCRCHDYPCNGCACDNFTLSKKEVDNNVLLNRIVDLEKRLSLVYKGIWESDHDKRIDDLEKISAESRLIKLEEQIEAISSQLLNQCAALKIIDKTVNQHAKFGNELFARIEKLEEQVKALQGVLISKPAESDNVKQPAEDCYLKKKTKTYWVNVYKTKYNGFYMVSSMCFGSWQAAKNDVTDGYIKTISFELEDDEK